MQRRQGECKEEEICKEETTKDFKNDNL